MSIKQFTYSELMSFNPCYDPTRVNDWTGDIRKALLDNTFDIQDLAWLIFREEFISDKLMRQGAINLVELLPQTNPDYLSMISIAKSFLDGTITSEDMEIEYKAGISVLRSAQGNYSCNAAAVSTCCESGRNAIISAVGNVKVYDIDLVPVIITTLVKLIDDGITTGDVY